MRYILADDRRTVRAERLLVTAAVCVMTLFAVLATITLLANGMVGWVPGASGGGAVTVLGAVARWGRSAAVGILNCTDRGPSPK